MTAAQGSDPDTTAPKAEAPDALDPDLADALVRLSFLVQSVIGRVADRRELSVPQFRLLAVLEDREIGMLELSRILELEKSSVTGLVDRAERRGLVCRVQVPGNRRAVHVILTPAGRSLVEELRPVIRDEILTTMAGALSATQQDGLRDSVATMIRQYVTRYSIPS